MGQLLVRNVEDEVIAMLRARAARHGRSVEAEHRALLKEVLTQDEAWHARREAFKARAAELRAELAGRDFTPSEILQREGRDER